MKTGVISPKTGVWVDGKDGGDNLASEEEKQRV